MDIVYLRFNKDIGHIGIMRRSLGEFKFTDAFTVKGINFTVKRCEGDELIQFWKDHGSHLEFCLSRNKKVKGYKDKKQGKKDNNFLKTPVKLGDET